jgi:hypothetical protein
MSSDRRPWFSWYPRDYIADEKVKALSDDAELVYRRALDVLWQSNDLQLPNNCLKLANQLARGWSAERFESAWNEIQTPGFEILKTTEDGLWVYSKRLCKEAKKIENISKKRSESGKKRAKQMFSNCSANDKQTLSHTDTDTDTDNNTPPISPLNGGGRVSYSESFEQWWSHYPKKTNKKAAFKKWKTIGKNKEATVSQLVDAIKNQVENDHFIGRDGNEYIPAPDVWLNKGKWMDEVVKKSSGSETNTPHPTTYAQCQDLERRQMARATLEYMEGCNDGEIDGENGSGRTECIEHCPDGQEDT